MTGHLYRRIERDLQAAVDFEPPYKFEVVRAQRRMGYVSPPREQYIVRVWQAGGKEYVCEGDTADDAYRDFRERVFNDFSATEQARSGISLLAPIDRYTKSVANARKKRLAKE